VPVLAKLPASMAKTPAPLSGTQLIELCRHSDTGRRNETGGNFRCRPIRDSAGHFAFAGSLVSDPAHRCDGISPASYCRFATPH